MTAHTPASLEVAEVFIWGSRIGAVAWDPAKNTAAFEYDADWLRMGLELSPFTLPRRPGITSFPELAGSSFRGLPGLVADSLPGRYGRRVIKLWLGDHNDNSPLTPVGQLRLVGATGRGALEYQPETRVNRSATKIEIDDLADWAQAVQENENPTVSLPPDQLTDLLAATVTTGGDQLQATIDWDPAANTFHHGDETGSGRWLIKFDTGHNETRVEYAYTLMAAGAGIEVPRSRLLVDQKGRAHIISRRVDRTSERKLHVQSMAALRHLDPDQPGAAHSYEQALSTTQSLGIHAPGVAQLYRRMVFNVVAGNQNDTTQKVAFTMGPAGQWRLAPAYDVTSAPRRNHRMTVNDKSADITKQDLQEVGRRFGIRDHASIIDAVISTVAVWDDYAAYAQVPPELQDDVGSTHHLGL